MVRPDMLDAVDDLCKDLVFPKSNRPFGGKQVILIGDLMQLEPVVDRKDEHLVNIFKKVYKTDSPFFFDANSYKAGAFKTVFFTETFRQKDSELLKNLQYLRFPETTPIAMKYLNSLKNDDHEFQESAVNVVATNKQAKVINDAKLEKLSGAVYTYFATAEGEFDKEKDNNLPAPKELTIKKEALINFNTNNYSSETGAPIWLNGYSGIVIGANEIDKAGNVYMLVYILNTGAKARVYKHTWEKKKYAIDPVTDEIIQNTVGKYTQYPIQLGWAITAHKAQGKTLDKAIIRLSNAFAAGQLYTGLTRTRSGKDMHISGILTENANIISNRVLHFLYPNKYPNENTIHVDVNVDQIPY
jgi:ATP-dependent exoDNAse (exonuclease V) alpha subunit